MPSPQPSVFRALGKVSIGVQIASLEREAKLAHTEMTNMHQLVQVPISGFVGLDPTHAEDVRVAFPYPFVNGASRTDSNLDVPHFTHGAELLSPLPVMILPHVVGWEQTDDGWFTAAKVRISAWIPSALKKHHFNAMLHCTFTGFAAPTEDEDSIDVSG